MSDWRPVTDFPGVVVNEHGQFKDTFNGTEVPAHFYRQPQPLITWKTIGRNPWRLLYEAFHGEIPHLFKVVEGEDRTKPLAHRLKVVPFLKPLQVTKKEVLTVDQDCQWHVVPGFHHYRVNQYGIFLNCQTYTYQKPNYQAVKPVITLFRPGEKRTFKLARLVLYEAFFGPIPKGYVVGVSDTNPDHPIAFRLELRQKGSSKKNMEAWIKEHEANYLKAWRPDLEQ